MSTKRLRFIGLVAGLTMLSMAVSFALSAPQRYNAGPSRQRGSGVNSQSDPAYPNASSHVRYVGSRACKNCHQSEYEPYMQTPHGQAATLPEGRPELKDLPVAGSTICPNDGERCFRVFPAKDGYFMSQFDRGTDGKESHIEVEKIAFALGKPLRATGYLIQRGDYLFEAPLTFYDAPDAEHHGGWALSPGYDKDPLGFTRPVVDSCLTCHVGRPNAIDPASNLYRNPPFEELTIGCESCHGPGALHVEERQRKLPRPAGPDTSIVNPKNLSSQLADETCMYCHELGEARIPQPGKSFQDYRPSVPLLRTEAIFKSKLLLGWNVEEWSDEMATSACYRFSKGEMRCSTCHDAHYTPTAQEAPSFYRAKCLMCHQSSSCSLPITERQQTQPVDNCITCHMPKHVAPKLVKVGGQGPSHRITKTEGEAIPEVDSPQTSKDLASGLILIDSDSSQAQKNINPIVLLKAYQAILAHDRTNDISERYESLLQSLSNDREDASVFSALATLELAKHTAHGDRMAIHDLAEAVRLHSDTPKDYLLLSELEYRTNDLNAAIATLTEALAQFPYVPTAYENLAVCYLRAGQTSKAQEIIDRGLEKFPSDKNLLVLDQRTHP